MHGISYAAKNDKIDVIIIAHPVCHDNSARTRNCSHSQWQPSSPLSTTRVWTSYYEIGLIYQIWMVWKYVSTMKWCWPSTVHDRISSTSSSGTETIILFTTALLHLRDSDVHACSGDSWDEMYHIKLRCNHIHCHRRVYCYTISIDRLCSLPLCLFAVINALLVVVSCIVTCV